MPRLARILAGLLLLLLLLPGLAQALSFDVTRIDHDLVGDATADVRFLGNTIAVDITLSDMEWYSAGRVVVDLRVESAYPIAFVTGSSIDGRDAYGCTRTGGCDPLDEVSVAMYRLGPDDGLVSGIEPRCCGFAGDVTSGAAGLALGEYRFVVAVSQHMGSPSPLYPPTDTHLFAHVDVVPEPSAALVFAAGLLACRWGARRARSG